jgi:hypothetical protein
LPKEPKKPSFATKSELARWVDEVNLGRGGRVSSAAFLPADGETYLSVNCVEIESLEEIAEYYRSHFVRSNEAVFVSCLKVMDYIAASKEGAFSMKFDKESSMWLFEMNGNFEAAFRARPNHLSKSHCGVETINSMTGNAANKFARRLSGKPPRRNPHTF